MRVTDLYPQRSNWKHLRVAALAGGVGGAKLAHGLAQALPAEALTVIVNTGDDFNHLGLRICPDIDTVCYTLAGLANPTTGWGRAGENWCTFEALERLGGPNWFRLGDLDLATHLERTRRLVQGESLSRVTQAFCAAWGVEQRILPMTDQSVATWVETEESGWLPFQEYFVHQRCEPQVKGFRFEGADSAKPAPGVVETIMDADLVVICPSNPWVSIGPILAIAPIADLIREKKVVAVSPIIGGQAIKGPAAKMYQELGLHPSALAVAEQYGNLINGFVIDTIDQSQEALISQLGFEVLVTNSVMKTDEDRRRLAEETLAFGLSLERRHPAR